MSKIHTETWLNFLSLDDDWKDEATNMRRLKKRSLSKTTEEEGDDLIDVDDDDDMEVDADIPADDDDEVQVMSNLDAAMVDDLAEACQKGTWVKKGTEEGRVRYAGRSFSSSLIVCSSQERREAEHKGLVLPCTVTNPVSYCP